MVQTTQPTEIPVGNIKEVRPETRIQDMMRQARTYGPIYQLPMPGGKRRIVLSSFALIDEVCNDAYFDKVIALTIQAARILAGDGLFTAETSDPNWRKAHSILMPAFSRQAMRNYLPMMEDIAEQLVGRWQRLNTEDEINVVNDMTRLTLDTIGLCGFNYRFNSFAREEMHPFVQSLNRILAVMSEAANQSPLEKKLRVRQRWQREQDLDLMFTTVDRLIQERKASGAEGAKIHDLLNAMLTGADPQTGEKLDDGNVRDQIMTFLIAGHETTSSLLSFALYFLINHPGVLARAYEEVDRVMGRDLKTPPTYEQVQQLQYIAQILKEALRLCPPVTIFQRHAYEDRVLAGRYQISPDDVLQIFVPMLHRDRSVWGDHAEIFNPDDHFSPEAEQARPGNAFKPFGIGQRSCIGRQFAMQEAALALGMILQQFVPFTTRTYQLQIKEIGAIKPSDFFIKVKPRTDIDHDTIFTSPGNGTVATVMEKPAATEQAVQAVQAMPVGEQGSLLVLYGSNMGTSEELANRIAEDGQAKGLTVAVDILDDYMDKLPQNGATVIVTSSYNGAPPDNAAGFCHWLQNGIAPDALKGLRYTIFGCGNRDWAATYQRIPHLIDSNLEKYGATRVYQLGEGNAAGDFDGQFQTWYKSLWDALAPSLSLDTSVVAEPRQQLPTYEVEIIRHPHPYPFVNSFGAVPMTLVGNRELCAPAAERSVRHIQIALPGGVPYRSGGHLGIVPSNGSALVKRVADHFHFDEQTIIQLHKRDGRKETTPVDQPISIYDGLANYVELQDVAKRAQIRRMAEYTNDGEEKQRLEHLSGDSEESAAAYKAEILNKRKSVIDLLEEYTSCALPFNIYLELLTPLRPRYYSISSSPLANPDECCLTVGVVKGPAKSGRGEFEGVCSNYLRSQQEGNTVYAFVQNIESPFHLPEDARTPIIMIGPGTGLAPFRGFLQERAKQQQAGKPIGTSLLFFGCRHPAQDYLYKEELEIFERDGVTNLYPAFSRLDPEHKVYVQDKIYEHKDEVWQRMQDGAIVYICGDTSHMVPDVRRTFARIYQEKTGQSEEEANSWLDDLTVKNRYMVDIWGI